MSQMPWERGDQTDVAGTSRSGEGPDEAVDVIGRAVARPGIGIVPPAPPAHRPWGPEFWPAEVRANVTTWPPVFRERELINAVRTPLTGTRRIALVSNKDGVGKSTAALILQSIFATHRGERCAVVDCNVGAADSHRLLPATEEMQDVVERAGGPSPLLSADPADTDYAALLFLLSEAFPIVICDVGTSIGEAATRRILDCCDQLVVVATPQVDGLYAASSCLDDLRQAGYDRLADDAICAINRIRPMPFSDLVNIDRHFQRRCREVIRIAWDSRATRGNAAHTDDLRPTTRTGFFELAAAVARSFGNPAPTKTPREEEEEEN